MDERKRKGGLRNIIDKGKQKNAVISNKQTYIKYGKAFVGRWNVINELEKRILEANCAGRDISDGEK